MDLILKEKTQFNNITYLSDLSREINHIKGFENWKDYENLFSKENPIRYLVVNLEKGLFLSIVNNQIKVYFYKEKELLKILKDLKNKMDKEGLYNYCENVIKKYKVYLRSKEKGISKELKKGDKIIKEGNYLYTSWGYDQTNIEYFKILKIIGKNYFIIQEVSQYNNPDEETQMTYYNVLPTDNFIKMPQKAYISNEGYASICETGYKRGLYIWDKKSKYKTNSQFGH